MTSRRSAASIPSGWNSFATMRMPTTKSSPTRARTAASTSRQKRVRPSRSPPYRVGPGVVQRGEELVQQIAVRHVDLDAVEASCLGDLGGIRPRGRESADLGDAHLPRRVRCRRRQHARRSIYRARAVRSVGSRLRAVVVELYEDARAGRSDGIRHPSVGLDGLTAERVLESADRAGGMHELIARDEEAAPALRPAHEVRGLALGLHAVGILLRMGGLQDPVGHRDAADPQRSEQRGGRKCVDGHCAHLRARRRGPSRQRWA